MGLRDMISWFLGERRNKSLQGRADGNGYGPWDYSSSKTPVKKEAAHLDKEGASPVQLAFAAQDAIKAFESSKSFHPQISSRSDVIYLEYLNANRDAVIQMCFDLSTHQQIIILQAYAQTPRHFEWTNSGLQKLAQYCNVSFVRYLQANPLPSQ